MTSGKWASSGRRAELPPDWDRLVALVRQRCHGRCEQGSCMNPMDDCDHRDDPFDHRLDNLQGLCRFHHNQKTQREAFLARQHNRRQRQPERHPGDRSPR